MNMLFFSLLVISLFSSAFSLLLDREFTVEIKAGKADCFFQEIKSGQVLDVEYQVIDGGQGELDINFHMYNPLGQSLIFDYKKMDGSHKVTISDDGDYKLCWDNKISHFNTKTVFFALYIEGDEDEEIGSPYKPEDVYDMKVEDIKDAVDKIKTRLTKSRLIQDQLRAHEARDRNVGETNFSRVNSLSLINVIVMLFTGIIQVILVRSLFDEKSRFHKVWKKSGSSIYS